MQCNIGLFPSLRISESARQLSDEVKYHPVMEKLERICADLIVIDIGIKRYIIDFRAGSDILQ
jgi:hypothetical protein